MQLKRSKKTLAPTSHFVHLCAMTRYKSSHPIFWILVVSIYESWNLSVIFRNQVHHIASLMTDGLLATSQSLRSSSWRVKSWVSKLAMAKNPAWSWWTARWSQQSQEELEDFLGGWNRSCKSVGIDIFCGVLQLKYFCFLMLDSHDMR